MHPTTIFPSMVFLGIKLFDCDFAQLVFAMRHLMQSTTVCPLTIVPLVIELLTLALISIVGSCTYQ